MAEMPNVVFLYLYFGWLFWYLLTKKADKV